MTRWFTSDLHLGHRNIIKYCGRPFDDVAHMNWTMINRWNEVVRPDDTVWVLGDFAMGVIADTLAMVDHLIGHKILLAGNHDRCWSGHGRRSEGWAERYLDAGFDEVHQDTEEIDIDATTLLMCHFPYQGDSHDEERYLEHRPVDHGTWLLHGHVHERWRRYGRMINVGVDANDFRPVSEEEISEMLRSSE